MAFELPALPYEKTALAPHISEETLDYHYGKHHATYVATANKLVVGTEYENASLEEIILNAPPGPIFNNCAQIWNHTFYFNGLSPQGGGEPTGNLKIAIEAAFGDFASFKDKFTTETVGNFGCGWTWLVKDRVTDQLEIVKTSGAGNPLKENKKPLVAVDVWEHAYYIDYRNARPKYVEAFWALVNWDFVAQNLEG